MYRALALFVSLVACGSAPAVTLQQLSMDEMAQSATAIVRAHVVSAAASFTGSTIYTHYKLRVDESLKGFPATEVMVPGGSVRNAKQSFPGVPELTTGAEYVLFLWTSPGGITHLLGMQQGVFSVTGTDDASRLATRAHIGEMMLDRSGRRVADEQIQIRLSDLRTRVIRATSPSGSAQ